MKSPSAPLDSSLREPLWTRSFIVLTCSYFCLFLSLQMLLSPFPFYVKDRFDPGDVTLSLVTSLFAFTAIVTRFVTAALMQRVNRNVLLYSGMGIAILSTAVYSFADTIAQVFILRILFGVGFGIGSTVMPTIVSRIIPQRRMGEGIGYFGLSTSLAMSVGPMIGLTLLGSYGFGTLTVWGTAAVAAIIPLLAFSRVLPPAVKAVGGAVSSSRRTPDSTAAETAPRLGVPVLPIILNTLLSACYGGLISFLALYGREIGLANIGLFFLFNAVTVLAVRPVSGRLFDRIGPGIVLVPAAVLLVISLMLLSMTGNMLQLIVSALLFGLGYGAIQPTIQAWMLGGAPREKHGLINSLFYNSIDLGVAVGSMVLGAVASATSYAVMYRYSAGIMCLFLLVYALNSLAGKMRSPSAAPAVKEL
jgi:MFS family permease